MKHPIDKRVYKAPTIPVCHDFNVMTRSVDHLDLVVGFSTGPLQYLNPLEKLAVCAFNEDVSCSLLVLGPTYLELKVASAPPPPLHMQVIPSKL